MSCRGSTRTRSPRPPRCWPGPARAAPQSGTSLSTSRWVTLSRTPPPRDWSTTGQKQKEPASRSPSDCSYLDKSRRHCVDDPRAGQWALRLAVAVGVHVAVDEHLWRQHPREALESDEPAVRHVVALP